MFDFSTLTAIAVSDEGKNYSFVGICDDHLRLPKGCDAWADRINGNNEQPRKFTAMQEAFLSLYRTLRVYRQARSGSLTNDRDSAQHRQKDGLEVLGGHEEDGSIIYYRHLDMLDGILDAYNELAILSLAQRLGRSDRLDCSKLHLYMDRATFSEDDSFSVDEMMLPRQQISLEPVEIVQMYCFTLLEVKKWLGEANSVTSDVRVLAEQFFEHHLATGDSLFEFATWQHTRNILRERLEIIDQNTAYKDDAYHDFYDVLERFLWGDEKQSKGGIQWGISTFAPVWESICLNYLIDSRLREIQACDTSSLPDVLTNRLTSLTKTQELLIEGRIEATLYTISELNDVFELNGTHLFPDCVLSREHAWDLEDARNLMYKTYGVNSLSDGSSGTDTKKIDVRFRPIWDGIKSRNGPTQRREAANLQTVLAKGLPDNLTAFFLGRALSGAFESTDAARDLRENICEELVLNAVGSPFQISLLQGVTWEVYFDKNDQFRNIDSLAHRKDLYSYRLAMNCIEANRGQFPEIEYLYTFAHLAETVIEGNKLGQSTIIDFKYLNADYFQDKKNFADIRIRSVRKQFVYEYLLKKKLGDRYSIGSEFWLPDHDNDFAKIELGAEQFLGGFIPLRRLNVMGLMDSYRKLFVENLSI